MAACAALHQHAYSLPGSAVVGAAAMRAAKAVRPTQTGQRLGTQGFVAVAIHEPANRHPRLKLDSAGRHSCGSVEGHCQPLSPQAHQMSLVDLGAASGRHNLGADYRTETWEAARAPPQIKMDMVSVMAPRKVEAVFLRARRVNFVLDAAAIAPSGVSFGVVEEREGRHGCTAVSLPLKLDARGLQCQELDGLVYFCLQR